MVTEIPALPVAGAEGESRLADAAVRYWNVRAGVTAVIVVAAAWGLSVWVPWEWLSTVFTYVVLPLGLISLALELGLLNRLQVLRYSYTVTPDYVYIAKGYLWRRSITLPRSQILNVETVRGPLLRAFGLVSVKFTCIVEIEPLAPVTIAAAERIRATILDADRVSTTRG